HLGFEVQPVPKHHISIFDGLNIPGRRLIRVGVTAWPDHGGDLSFGCNVFDGVCQVTGGGINAERVFRIGCSRSVSTTTQQHACDGGCGKCCNKATRCFHGVPYSISLCGVRFRPSGYGFSTGRGGGPARYAASIKFSIFWSSSPRKNTVSMRI